MSFGQILLLHSQGPPTGGAPTISIKKCIGFKIDAFEPTLAPSLPAGPGAPRGPVGPATPLAPRSPGAPLSPYDRESNLSWRQKNGVVLDERKRQKKLTLGPDGP